MVPKWSPVLYTWRTVSGWECAPGGALRQEQLVHHGCVPWRPLTDDLMRRDPQLDPFRERAAFLIRDGERVATLYLRAEAWWEQTGGHLWWRTWSEAKEHVHGFVLTQAGAFDDFIVDADDVHDELPDWVNNIFEYRGEILTVRWLDDASSRTVRADVFGLDEYEEPTPRL
ncbi:hypothetical protein GCM10023193_46350 [Planotetraspora kaengkrachanensis]|uniref:Uncharacterized protein n=1 Tax=Planotetraspora kaengkrachanensis TaxID=575193 RepID=A0A8J3LXK7_9ACTN|nr:hypothetical protein Pka01_37040 [Planotetraspora kaengkrachanensis]